MASTRNAADDSSTISQIAQVILPATMRTMAYVSMTYQLILTERKTNVCNLCENSYVTAHMTCVHLFDHYT